MINHNKNLIEFFIDGKFIKLVRTPILDFLKFQTNIYPFYKRMSAHTTSNLIHQIGCLEPIIFNKYKRLGQAGILYSGKSFFIYTHYGAHLRKLNSDINFLTDLIQISNTYYNIPTFKRIDFAYDFYGIDLIELIKSSHIHSKKQLKVRYMSYEQNNSKTRISKDNKLFYSNIETIYIGSLNSKISFCIYKRHLKLGVSGPITRLEIRFKGQATKDLVSKISLLKDPIELNNVLANYINKYLSFKLKGSSKSSRLSRHKTVPWWKDFMDHLYSNIE